MKKMIRQTCFGMAAMMGILMLAGCGSGNTGSSNTSQTTAAAEQKADAGNDVESGSPSIEKTDACHHHIPGDRRPHPDAAGGDHESRRGK